MKRGSVRLKIFLGLILVTFFAIITIMLTVYQKAYTTLRDNEMRYNVEATDRTRDRLEYALNLVYKTGQSIKENSDLQKYLKVLNENPRMTSARKNQMSTLLNSYVYTLSNITGIHVVGRQNWQFFSSIPSANGRQIRQACQVYFDEPQGNRLPNTFTGQEHISYYPGVEQEVVQFLTPMYNVSQGELLGVIVIDLSYGMLEEMFLASSKENEDKAFIVKGNGEIVFRYPYNINFDSVIDDYPQLATTKNSQFKGEVFSSPMLIVSETIRNTDWHIVRMMSMNRITKDTRELQRIMIWITLLCTVGSILFSSLLARVLTAPITKLLMAFQKAEEGNLSIRMHIDTNDELSQLGDGFNTMIEKLDEGFQIQLDTQKKKADMELEVLQAQINPHFLYNALDSIKWLAMLQGIENIGEMTTALISLLRYNLSKDGFSVTLKEEMKSVEDYLLVQKYRYGDGIVLSQEINQEAWDFPMPRFLLQPLVENCVVHAFDGVERTWNIKITAKVDEVDRLHVYVIDNGKGMNIQEALWPKEEKNRFSNIGIVNIQERLRLYFGNTGSLTYESEKGKGTIAKIVIPRLPGIGESF